MVSQKRIVVIEDEPDILEVLTYNLNREGFDVKSELDGARGLELITRLVPDLVVLDLMLPGMDGLEICRRLKSEPSTSRIPVIMVTAKGEESDVVLGLGIGADDYICKPFSPREFVARVKAVLRRGPASESLSDNSRIEVEGVVIDPEKYTVSADGAAIKMTPTEFKVLLYLMSNPGRVFSREQILNHAIGTDIMVVDRNIDVHIRAIRKKLGAEKELIETIRGIGYRFRDID